MPVNALPWALARTPGPAYAHATRLHPGPPLDVALACAQHAAYLQAVRDLGVEVTELPPDPDGPDACFVEDMAVVVGERALLTRSGHAGRRAESAAVAEALAARGLDCVAMEPPGTLDGGDVLRVDRTLFVGLSARTNRAGIDVLSACFRPLGCTVHALELPVGILHLKSLCSAPAVGVVVVAEGTWSPARFPAPVVVVPRAEARAANVVGRDGTVLVPSGFPRSVDALQRAGLAVRTLDNSEVARGDGAFTCLSIRTGW